MLRFRLNLRTKTLWIPVAIVVMAYLIIGLAFSRLLVKNAHNDLHHDIAQAVENEKKQLYTGLSLVTSTYTPADAFLGLEGDDDEIAKDLLNQVKSMGLNGTYFTDLNGKTIYPKEADLPDSFSSVLKQASKSRGDINIIYHNTKMLGYAPIVDVETPKGFLVLEMNIPDELIEDVKLVFADETDQKEKSQNTLVSQHLKEIYSASHADIEKLLRRMIVTIAVILLPTLFLIITVLGTTSQNIIRPIRQLLGAFNRQAEGDLTQEVHVKSGDEIARLTQTFNETNRKLNEMLYNVASHSRSVAASASQLSVASRNISGNAHNQSGKTAQAASAMEEMNSSFVEVAKNTTTAAESASEANELALKGGEVVTETINGMNQISQSVNKSSHIVEALGKRSEQIGEIIRVINDIADQTNLLALNAAIEAARAGEQGRGFAVVADEVRKLAERTTTATNEIGDMIKGIQEDTNKAVDSMQTGTKEVDEGVTLANRAGESLQHIVRSVQNVTAMVQQTAAAVEEQSATGEEIAANLESVSDLTRQTADAVQNSSESIQNLNDLAQKLQHLVSGFKLQHGNNSIGNQYNNTYRDQNTVTAGEMV